MPEACLSLWPSDQCEWSIVDILRWSDLIQLSIYVGLALMLGHTFFIVIRFFGRYASTRRELRDCESDFGPDFHRKSRRLIADLSRGLRTLRGIAYAAPILALAGTSYGILAAPSWFHYSGVNGLFRDLAATVINTAVGILIAASATLSHNLLRTRAEALSEKLLPRRHSHEYNLGSFQYAQTLRLKKRPSGPPHFALIAVPVLALLVMAYLVFKPYPMPTGLSVGLLANPADRGDRPQPIVVTILANRDDIPLILVNSKKVQWDNLQEVASEKLGLLAERRAYIEADESVRWAYVVEVVDMLEKLHCRAVLLTSTPAHKSCVRAMRFSIAEAAPLR